MNEKIQEITVKVKALQNKMKDLLAKELVKMVKGGGALLESVSFTAYTPYFNDGEVCEYRVNSDADYMIVDVAGGESVEVCSLMDQFCDDVVSKWSDATKKETARVYLGLESVHQLPEKTYIWKKEVTEAKKAKLQKIEKIVEEIADFIDEFDDDMIKMAFGDHVRVVITKNGIKLEKYEHE